MTILIAGARSSSSQNSTEAVNPPQSSKVCAGDSGAPLEQERSMVTDLLSNGADTVCAIGKASMTREMVEAA